MIHVCESYTDERGTHWKCRTCSYHAVYNDTGHSIGFFIIDFGDRSAYHLESGFEPEDYRLAPFAAWADENLGKCK